MAESDREFDCDPGKRAKLLRERQFDLLDVSAVFEDLNKVDFVDDRFKPEGAPTI